MALNVHLKGGLTDRKPIDTWLSGDTTLVEKETRKVPCLSDIVPQNTSIPLDNHSLFARSSENTSVKPRKPNKTVGLNLLTVS